MRTEIQRTQYLNRLRSMKDRTDVIKVISGMRRCGKTTLMRQFMEHLKNTGVAEEDIVYINLESLETGITDFMGLYNSIKEKLQGRKKYVFLDEVQIIEGWERAVNSARVDFDVDLYVTGSNAHLLSSELSTLLTGRTMTIDVYPLSFREFLELNPTGPSRSDLTERYDDYVRIGSLPMVRVEDDPENTRDMLIGLLNTIINRDIAPRHEIRDFTTLYNLIMFVMDNIGNTLSPSSIAKELGLSSSRVIDSYLTLLEQAFIIRKARRYDLKGKKILKTNSKYYCTDIGLRSASLGHSARDRGHILENLVFLELVRRGYNVNVGSYRDKEIDFTATDGKGIHYYQVTWELGEWNIDREAGNLTELKDNYPKTIITSTEVGPYDDLNGIRVVNHLDFLLGLDLSTKG